MNELLEKTIKALEAVAEAAEQFAADLRVRILQIRRDAMKQGGNLKTTLTILVLILVLAAPAHAEVCTESYADLTVVIPFDSGPVVYEYGPNHAPWASFSFQKDEIPLSVWQAADTAVYRAVLSQSLFRHQQEGRISCAQVREVMSIAAESGYQIASTYAAETHAYWRALIRDPAVHWSPVLFTLMQWSYVGAWSAGQVDRMVGVVTRGN